MHSSFPSVCHPCSFPSSVSPNRIWDTGSFDLSVKYPSSLVIVVLFMSQLHLLLLLKQVPVLNNIWIVGLKIRNRVSCCAIVSWFTILYTGSAAHRSVVLKRHLMLRKTLEISLLWVLFDGPWLAITLLRHETSIMSVEFSNISGYTTFPCYTVVSCTVGFEPNDGLRPFCTFDASTGAIRALALIG